MITEPSAFIIGAGASKPYGLPTGLELREMIVHHFVNADVFSGLHVKGFNALRFQDFCRAFLESGIQSIDQFLALRPEFIVEGKVAICFSIKEKEFEARNTLVQVEWLQFLYNRMVSGISTGAEHDQFLSNKVYFCTFNYDRLLEYYLANSFFHSFSSQEEILKLGEHQYPESIRKRFTFEIDHVYGQIGDLSYNPIDASFPDRIRDYYSDVLLAGERPQTLTTIRDRIQLCKRVYFLGYGFNETNNQLLDLAGLLRDRIVYATGVGLLPQERLRIQANLGQKIEFLDGGCHELLRRFL